MISAKVTHAIHVLLQIERQQRYTGKVRLFTPADFGTQSFFHKATLRAVLKTLTEKGYIGRKSGRGIITYELLRDPAQVTVYELVCVFHGSICIGEAYDHRLMVGAGCYPVSEHRALSAFGKELTGSLERALQVPITRFAVSDAGYPPIKTAIQITN